LTAWRSAKAPLRLPIAERPASMMTGLAMMGLLVLKIDEGFSVLEDVLEEF